MATKGERTKSRLIEAMLELIQARGYAGTGLNAVIEHAGAPKGSLYFHFPEGKEALGAAAVALAARDFESLVATAALAGGPPSTVASQVVEVLADLVVNSDYALGCPVSVVTLEMASESELLRTSCAAAFESWITPVRDYLEAYGCPPEVAAELASTIVATIEGAVILSRAQRSVTPLGNAGRVIARLIDGSVATDGSK